MYEVTKIQKIQNNLELLAAIEYHYRRLAVSIFKAFVR